jgi:hypothetical protein
MLPREGNASALACRSPGAGVPHASHAAAAGALLSVHLQRSTVTQHALQHVLECTGGAYRGKENHHSDQWSNACTCGPPQSQLGWQLILCKDNKNDNPASRYAVNSELLYRLAHFASGCLYMKTISGTDSMQGSHESVCKAHNNSSAKSTGWVDINGLRSILMQPTGRPELEVYR